MQDALDLFVIASSLYLCQAGDLLLANLVIINLPHFEVLFLLIEPVLVDANLHFGARVELGLAPRSTLLDPHLWHTALNGLGHPTKLLNFLDYLTGLRSQLVSQCFHHVRATPWVNDVRNSRLLL